MDEGIYIAIYPHRTNPSRDMRNNRSTHGVFYTRQTCLVGVVAEQLIVDSIWLIRISDCSFFITLRRQLRLVPAHDGRKLEKRPTRFGFTYFTY